MLVRPNHFSDYTKFPKGLYEIFVKQLPLWAQSSNCIILYDQYLEKEGPKPMRDNGREAYIATSNGALCNWMTVKTWYLAVISIHGLFHCKNCQNRKKSDQAPGEGHPIWYRNYKTKDREGLQWFWAVLLLMQILKGDKATVCTDSDKLKRIPKPAEATSVGMLTTSFVKAWTWSYAWSWYE